MQSIKIETPFKGLYTNASDREINYSFFADTDKVKVTKQYLQSEKYQIGNSFGTIGENYEVVEVKKINLDTSDRYYYYNGINTYKPDYFPHIVVIANDITSNNQVVLVYGYYGQTGFTYVPIYGSDRINDFKKMIEYQGTLKILTGESIYSLQYKMVKIQGVYRRSLVLVALNGKVEKNLSVSTATNLSTSNFQIKILTTPFEMVYRSLVEIPSLAEYRVTKASDGTDLTWAYEFVFENYTDPTTGLTFIRGVWKKTNTPLYFYYGLAYVISYYQPPYDFSNKGRYDYDNVDTFLAVPKKKINGYIYYGMTRLTFHQQKALYPNPYNSFTAQVNNDEVGYWDSNYPHTFADENDMTNTDFFSKISSTVSFTSTTEFKLEDFLTWISEPNNVITYTGTKAVSNGTFGFDTITNPEQKYVTVIQTVSYGDEGEVIIGYGTAIDTGNLAKTIYKVNPVTAFNALATTSKLYIGFGIKPTSFEQAKIWNLAKKETPTETYLGYPDLTGILISNMLSIYGDVDQFEYVNGGSDYVLINNIGFLIKGGTVYYSPNDMTNSVFYKNRYIPNIYGDALISIGGMLGVIRYNKDVTLISIQVIENELYFKVYDTVSFVIKDKHSYLEIPDGVLMSLREGLYLSTPQERQLLSEPINDIFESGNVSKLLYDDYNRRIMVQSGDDTYVFDLINKVWIKHKGLKLKNIAFDGTDVITIDGSSFAKVTLSNKTEGEITFHKVNLGSNKITKKLIGLRIDLEGTLTTFSNSFGHHGAVNALNEQRRIEEYYIPFNDQLPEVGLDFTIKFKGKIYGIEVLYDVVGEFVNTKILEN